MLLLMRFDIICLEFNVFGIEEILTLSQLTTGVARSATVAESLDSRYQGCLLQGHSPWKCALTAFYAGTGHYPLECTISLVFSLQRSAVRRKMTYYPSIYLLPD